MFVAYISFKLACVVDVGLHPLQLIAGRAPSFPGVCSNAVASQMEGLLVERSSL